MKNEIITADMDKVKELANKILDILPEDDLNLSLVAISFLLDQIQAQLNVKITGSIMVNSDKSFKIKYKGDQIIKGKL